MTDSTPSAPAPAVLTVRGLAKAFGGRTVLRDFAVHVEAGEVVALVGPNGAGKSTALRCIVGVEAPDAGEVLLGEHPVDTRNPQTRRALCVQLGESAVLPELTVAEHLDLIARAHGADDADRASGAIVQGALGEARLESVADQLPWTLSSGQTQRFALATAMVRPWALLVADEPEQRLDEEGRAWLGTWCAAQAAAGRAILLACHDPSVIAAAQARVVWVQGDV